MKQANTYTLISGATSGIDLELAKIFAKNGHYLIVASVYQSNLD